MGNIEISGLTHQYADTNGQLITAIDNISLSVSNGRFMSIVGPSGCGKTTLLNIVPDPFVNSSTAIPANCPEE